MIQIGKSQVRTRDGRACLWAEVSIDGRRFPLWFSVDASQERGLSVGRADPFVMALFPAAMREGHEIVCEDPLSERLCYQLGAYLPPILAAERGGEPCGPVKITAPLTAARYPSAGAAGVGFSQGEAFLRAVRRHAGGSEYPLTHVIAAGVHRGQAPEPLQKIYDSAKRFAEEQRLQAVLLDTNLGTVLPEAAEEVYRELACALALQGLLSVYLLPPAEESDPAAPVFRRALDLLISGCASTETLAVYPAAPALAGEEALEPRAESQPIRVGAPYLEEAGEQTRLCAPVSLGDGEDTALWFSVKREYAPCFVTDRADAFAAALLTTAMREGRDIVCDAPVTRRLLYQLNRLLIPIMSSTMAEYRPIQIRAEAAGETEERGRAVGTGWTGGVDSLFTVTESLRAESPAYRLTHLLITSNGAIEGSDPSGTLKKMGEKAEKGIIPELGLDLLCVDSNLGTVLQENFSAVLTIRHAAVILALQGLYKAFFVSSSFAYTWLSFLPWQMDRYDTVVLLCLGTDRTALYTTGCAHTRIEKLERLSESPLAQRYLHPCIYALRDNCGTCGKCVRTQLELYALRRLDRFSAAFDIEQFQRNRSRHLANAFLVAGQSPFHASILKTCRENGISLLGARFRVPGLFVRRAFVRLKSVFRK